MGRGENGFQFFGAWHEKCSTPDFVLQRLPVYESLPAGGLKMKKVLCFGYVLLVLAVPAFSETNKPPVRLGIVGLVHSHVHGFLPRALADSDVQLVGIVEPDQQLVVENARRYKLSTNL